MSEKTSEIKKEFLSELEKTSDISVLENMRVKYLGKSGSITSLMKDMKSLSAEEKKLFGQAVNVLKKEVSEKLSEKFDELKKKAVEEEINHTEEFDISTPANLERGSYHPITLVQRECEKIFKSMGFTVEEYSEVVTDYECFESLNIPKHHPARDMQDTY